jgi:hypothetical protein
MVSQSDLDPMMTPMTGGMNYLKKRLMFLMNGLFQKTRRGQQSARKKSH